MTGHDTPMTGHDTPKRVYIGCAGWNFARPDVADPTSEGSQLQKYASLFRAVEINSSFHRSHRRATYERWSASVPDAFRFSVKFPKAITHANRLADSTDLTNRFLDEAMGLGSKLGALLVQLPPTLEYDAGVASGFFETVRAKYDGTVVIEPRHASWFVPDANKLMRAIGVTRVAADPAVVPSATEPGGNPGRVYFRLHGSPQVYYSSYTHAYLDALAFRIRVYSRAGTSVWCIFDNTIRGAATSNALHVMRKIVLEETALASRTTVGAPASR